MTDKRKVQIYEHFLHQIQLYSFTSPEKFQEGIEIICSWSYVHRMDTLTEEERDSKILSILFKMKDF